jgi:hypothetical protein
MVKSFIPYFRITHNSRHHKKPIIISEGDSSCKDRNKLSNSLVPESKTANIRLTSGPDPHLLSSDLYQTSLSRCQIKALAFTNLHGLSAAIQKSSGNHKMGKLIYRKSKHFLGDLQSEVSYATTT